MTNSETKDQILADYDANVNTYELLANKLTQLLREILRERGIQVHSINERHKTRTSLIGKLTKGENRYKNLTDLTDLAGLRIITYLAEDVDLVAKAIEEEFSIDSSNSIDKRRLLAADRFGYLSMHHVLSLNDSRCNLTEYKAFKGLKIEVQTRSILQHAWAEIEHDLGYKSEIEVPQHIRRRFALVAGLLEIADREFDEIKKELVDYRAGISKAVIETPQEVSINLDSIRALLTDGTIVDQLDKKIMVVNNALTANHYDLLNSRYLGYMEQMGIKTIVGLTSSLESQRDLILIFSKFWIGGNTSSIPSGASIFYLWLIWLADKSEAEIEEHLREASFDNPPSMAQRLIPTVKSAKQELLKKQTLIS